MNLNHLRDNELLSQIKKFVQAERDLLVEVLHHLREIDRRRLYVDLRYESLFEYAVGELKYSEGQANRRIQAMKLLKDVPEVGAKIADGSLNLSNVQQAQSFFRGAQKAEPNRIIGKDEKLEVLEKLENKSVRDAQKELIKLQPSVAMPKERERVITDDTSEVRFLMSDALKHKLEEVRSLLGPKGAMMSYAELFDAMSDLSMCALKAKHFGKKRSQEPVEVVKDSASSTTPSPESTPEPEVKVSSSNPRYIPKAVKHAVWQRDRGCCTNCGSRKNLNYDHREPVALGGQSTVENIRLLCFQCNQRASTKIFGTIYSRKETTI